MRYLAFVAGLAQLPGLWAELLYCNGVIDFVLVNQTDAELVESNIVKPLIDNLPNWLSEECHATLEYLYCLSNLSPFSSVSFDRVYCQSNCDATLSSYCLQYFEIFTDTAPSDVCFDQSQGEDMNCETGPGIESYLSTSLSFVTDCPNGFQSSIEGDEDRLIDGTGCQITCNQNGGGYSFFPTDTEGSIFYILFIVLSLISFLMSIGVTWVHYDKKKTQIYLNFSKFAVDKKQNCLRYCLYALSFSAANQISMFSVIFCLISFLSLLSFLINTTSDRLCTDDGNSYELFHSFAIYFLLIYAMVWGLSLSIFLFSSIVLIQKKKILVQTSFVLSIVSLAVCIILSLAAISTGAIGVDKQFNIGIGFIKSRLSVIAFVVAPGFVTCGLSCIFVIITVLYIIRLLSYNKKREKEEAAEVNAAKRKSRRKIARMMVAGTSASSRPAGTGGNTTPLEVLLETSSYVEASRSAEVDGAHGEERPSLSNICFLERPSEIEVNSPNQFNVDTNKDETEKMFNFSPPEAKNDYKSSKPTLTIDTETSFKVPNLIAPPSFRTIAPVKPDKSGSTWEDLEQLYTKLSPKHVKRPSNNDNGNDSADKTRRNTWRRPSVVEMDVDDVEDIFKTARDDDADERLPGSRAKQTIGKTDEEKSGLAEAFPTAKKLPSANFAKIVAYNRTIVAFLSMFLAWNIAACVVLRDIYAIYLVDYDERVVPDAFTGDGYHQVWRQFFVLVWLQGFGLLSFFMFGSRCVRHFLRWYYGKSSTPFANVPLVQLVQDRNIGELTSRKRQVLRNLNDPRKIDFLFRHPEMKNLIKKVSRKLCCEELFDFASVVEDYRSITSFNLDRQWKKYVQIIEEFLLENKINVSASMKRKTIKCYAAPASFTDMNMADRFNIFSEASEEVMLLLNTNVMFSIIKTAEYKKAFEEDEELTFSAMGLPRPMSAKTPSPKKSEMKPKPQNAFEEKKESYDMVLFDDSRVAQL